MGGKGSGGRRPGSGRKPKSNHLHSVQNTVTQARRGVVPTTNGAGPDPIDEFDAPDELTTEERLIWLKLAPEAFKNGTLKRSTAMAFELLCVNVAREKKMRVSVDCGEPKHNTLIKIIDSEMTAYSLRACGKAVYEAPAEAKPVDALAKFRRVK